MMILSAVYSSPFATSILLAVKRFAPYEGDSRHRHQLFDALSKLLGYLFLTSYHGLHVDVEGRILDGHAILLGLPHGVGYFCMLAKGLRWDAPTVETSSARLVFLEHGNLQTLAHSIFGGAITARSAADNQDIKLVHRYFVYRWLWDVWLPARRLHDR